MFSVDCGLGFIIVGRVTCIVVLLMLVYYVLSVLVTCSEYQAGAAYLYNPISFSLLMEPVFGTVYNMNFELLFGRCNAASREQSLLNLYDKIQAAATLLACLKQRLPFAFVCAGAFTFCACYSKYLVLSL